MCYKAGYTPLHTACHFGQMNMIRFLLDHGASVDATTKVSDSALSANCRHVNRRSITGPSVDATFLLVHFRCLFNLHYTHL